MTTLQSYLDPCFLPYGLEGKTSMAGTVYEGEINGRFTKIHCAKQKRRKYVGDVRYIEYTGHRLEYTFETPLQTRLVVTPSAGYTTKAVGFTNKWADTKQIAGLDPALDGLTVWAFDVEWATQFLARREVLDAIKRLIPDENRPPNVGVKLWPGKSSFSQRTDITNITPDAAAAEIEAMLALLAIAEEKPPLTAVSPTWLERTTSENPRLITWGIVFAIFAFLLLIACCVLAVVALAFVV